VLAVMLVLVAAGGWVAYQYSYDIREERVTIMGGTQPLHGVLALPEHGEGPFGLVVFVHGDGPIDATHDTFYRPIWEALAQAGFASISWNKPGIDGAPGNWLDQSMDDRAREVAAAIDWARQRTEIDPDRIGLWGASQAGWVMPKVAAADPLLRFIIAVSPAINWLQQGRYNLLAELAESGASPADVDAALARRDRNLQYLRADASYGDARNAGAADGMTPDRWTFAKRNYLSDASADLANVRVPVLLMLAGHDVNVDVADTESGYRRHLPDPGQLHIARYPDATHSLVPNDIEASTVKSTLVALVAPRSLFTPGALSAQRDFVATVATETRPGP
jgi:dienelactone hydrolase